MVKKINVELDVNVRGLGCGGKGFSGGSASMDITVKKDNAKELSKVFSGEDFSF